MSLLRLETDGRSESLFSDYQGGHHHQLLPPRNLTAVGGALFYTVNDGFYGYDCELWRSDGTREGTLRVPLPSGCGVIYLADVGGSLFFTHDEERGAGLWTVSESGQGPMLVSVFETGPNGYDLVRDLTEVDGALLFAVEGGSQRALWTSDGTVEGTVRLADFVTGPPLSTGPTMLMELSGVLLFGADDGQTGPALWESDGSVGGTLPVASLPNVLTEVFAPLVMAGDDVFFTARTDGNGVELWAMPVRALDLVCPSDCDSSGAVTIDEVVTGVRIGLDLTPLSTCDVADVNGDHAVAVDEVVLAVNRALGGCV